MKEVLDDDAFAFIQPSTPRGYNVMITTSTNEVTRAQKQTKHMRKVKEFEKYLEVEEASRVLILQAVDKVYIEALKKDYIGYNSNTANKILEHLQGNM